MKKKRATVAAKFASAANAAARKKFNATSATKIKQAVGKALFTKRRKK